MKKLTLAYLIFFCLLSFGIRAQDKTGKQKPEDQIRKYWFVMLLKGANRTQDSATAASIQKEHLANIGRFYNEGKIKVAGPFGDKGELAGNFYFRLRDQGRSRKLF